MAAADDLWNTVKLDYNKQALISLTNVRKRDQTAINETVGTRAAQSIINLFPTIVQEDYDESSSQHIEIAAIGVIAMLWRRGGTASQAMRVKWEDWVELAQTLKNVEPRGHAVPHTNSNLTPSQECRWSPCRPWSDRTNFRHLLPGPPGARRDPTEWV